MKSAESNKNHEWEGEAKAAPRSSRTAGDAALRLPFGAAGVASLCALALGLFGLLMPRAWLETISFQLYLDKITSAALPPLGTTAQIAAAIALALVGALFGWTIGRLFGVQPSSLSFHALMNRIRGVGADDEDGAPSLRAADRHPDAPARRPFSATRDIARREDPLDDEDDALLLDTQFTPVDDMAPPPPPLGAMSGTSFDDHWRDADDVPLVSHGPDKAPLMPQSSGLVDEDYAVTLPAPSLDDWERAPNPAVSAERHPFPPAAPVAPLNTTPRPPHPVAPVIRHAGAPEPTPEPFEPSVMTPARASLPPVEPLDLSAARLDDLLSRLESGLGRRHAQAPAAPTASAVAGLGLGGLTGEAGPSTPSPQNVPSPVTVAASSPAVTPASDARAEQQDPAYPQDPALAAALRTLRRMNQQATA